MSKGRFLNQKLGKRQSRRQELSRRQVETVLLRRQAFGGRAADLERPTRRTK